MTSSSSLNCFDGPLLTEFLQYLTPRDWLQFSQCASWCRTATEADVLWKYAAQHYYHLDLSKISVSKNWKNLVRRCFSHHPPEISNFLMPRQQEQEQQEQFTSRISTRRRLGSWRRIAGPKQPQNQQQQNISESILVHSFFDKDFSSIVDREEATDANLRKRLSTTSSHRSSSTTVTSFVVSRDQKEMILKIHAYIRKMCTGQEEEVEEKSSMSSIELPAYSTASGDDVENPSSWSLCEFFIFDLFPRDISGDDIHYHQSSATNVFLLVLVDNELAGKTLSMTNGNSNNNNSYHQYRSSDDEEQQQQQPRLLPQTPPFVQQQTETLRTTDNNNNDNPNETIAERRSRRTTTIETLERVMKLLYNISCSVVITLPNNNDLFQYHHDVQQQQQNKKCAYLEAILHVSAADQSIPEWTIPNQFPNTIFLLPSVSSSSSSSKNNNNNNNNNNNSNSEFLISDSEWNDFIKTHLGMSDRPAASSVSLFFATRSRETCYGTDLLKLLKMSLKFAAASSSRLTMNTSSVLEHPFHISWNIAPGLLSKLVASSSSLSSCYNHHHHHHNNLTTMSKDELFDIGLAPSLFEYLLFLVSAVNSTFGSETNRNGSATNTNNNNNNSLMTASHSESAATASSYYWWTPQLVMSFVQPQIKKIMEKFEKHMLEDDQHTIFSDGNHHHHSTDVVSAPLTSSNLNKMNKEFEEMNQQEDNHVVELIPDLEAHRALLALSDASESASSHGTSTANYRPARRHTTDQVRGGRHPGTRTTPTTTTNTTANNTTAAGLRIIRSGGNNEDNNNDDVNNNDQDAVEDDEDEHYYEFGDNEEDIVAQRILAAFNAADEGDDETARLLLHGTTNNINTNTNTNTATPNPHSETPATTNNTSYNNNNTTSPALVGGTTGISEVASGLSRTTNASHEDIIEETNDQHHHQSTLERVHGRCSALPAESPQSSCVPQHTSEFWDAHSRHAKMAFEFSLEVTRPYCTTRNFSLLIADAVRNQIDEVTRRLWSSFSDKSESYCSELALNVFKHLQCNYGVAGVKEHRREKNALKRWFSSAHEKIEEYLLKSRGPRRLQVLQRFVTETLVPDFIAACESDLSTTTSDQSTTTADDHHRSDDQTSKNNNNNNTNNNSSNIVHPEDARQAGSCLIREVDGMVLRCETNPMNDPRRLEFLKLAKSIALRFGDEVDATMNEHIMEAATASSIFDRRLTIRLHSISCSSSSSPPSGSASSSASSSSHDFVRNNNVTENNSNTQQHHTVVTSSSTNQNDTTAGNRGRAFLRSAVTFFSNMLHSNTNNNNNNNNRN